MALKLTQPELGILYVETQAPMGVQECLTHGQLHDQDKVALHQMISGQKPDVAIIALGLSGVVIANHILAMDEAIEGSELSVLVTELKHLSISMAEEYGRVWINAREHDKRGSEHEELELLEQAPEVLNALGSILEELQPFFDRGNFLYELIKLLGYQSYSQADLAEQYLDLIAANRAPHGDPIPLPMELQD